jgi:hypothetical protein
VLVQQGIRGTIQNIFRWLAASIEIPKNPVRMGNSVRIFFKWTAETF